jgi:hypothetical protein
VVRGEALVFTPDNFNVPQTVEIFGNEDANTRNARVPFTVSARGYTARAVSVRVKDNDPHAPAFTTPPRRRAVIDLTYRYQAEANGLPAPTFHLLDAPAGMTIDPETGLIVWTPMQTGAFPVTIKADNGLAPSAKQSFTLKVLEDQPPGAFLTAPADGATISGANAEFFGSASDDYGCYKAAFYVDDVIIYTDENRENHYHAGGAHQLFDTTVLTNGPHILKMIVFDDKDQTATATAQVTIAN